MVPRRAIAASILPLLFAGFGAWAQGSITGAVTDISTGESIFGARIADVTDEANEIPGSFAGDGAYFIRNLPEGTRLVKVTAEGYTDGFGEADVITAEPFTLNFELEPDISLNTAEITLPIDGSEVPIFLFPPIVEAVQNGVVVGRTFVRAGIQYRISGLPDGKTTFRAASPFYLVGETIVELSGDRPFTVVVPVSVPGTRGPITGSVGGVVDDGEIAIEAHVYATFLFEGVPVTVTSDSAPGTGAYQIDLLPTGPANIKAHAISTTHRSLLVPTSITVGFVETVDLTVLPFNPITLNFIPIVESYPAIVIDEDANHVFIIGAFSVTDSDHNFPAQHTLVIYPGFNYTHSNPQSKITPDFDWNGSLTVPVGMSDPLNTSAPFILTVTVNPVADATVYVDFDAGLPAGGGGTGGAANPFLAVGEALSEVTAGGTILIKGIASSTEPPFTINQDVSLQNDNGGPEVRIAPSGARQLPNRRFRAGATSPAKSGGFVTRSGLPRQ